MTHFVSNNSTSAYSSGTAKTTAVVPYIPKREWVESEALVPRMTKQVDANATTGMLSLAYMLQYRRMHKSRTEKNFIKAWLTPLGLDADDYGNLYCRIGDSRTMWSCHTDTVHSQTGMQDVSLLNNRFLALPKKQMKHSSCLGADDTAGIWLMREMILAKVPGLYIFHRGEETGGLGSQWLTKNNAKLVENIDHAIALDRKGYRDVITHQFGRCCSDEFATSLAEQIGMEYRKDTTGVFTDTANYTKLVPECTNLSVGYEGAHSRSEMVDVLHLKNLRDALCNIDTGKLKVARDPSKVEYRSYNEYGSYGGWDVWDDDNLTRKTHGYSNGTRKVYGTNTPQPSAVEVDPDYPEGRELHFDPTDTPFDTFKYLAKNFPDELADWLEFCGLDPNDAINHVRSVIC